MKLCPWWPCSNPATSISCLPIYAVQGFRQLCYSINTRSSKWIIVIVDSPLPLQSQELIKAINTVTTKTSDLGLYFSAENTEQGNTTCNDTQRKVFSIVTSGKLTLKLKQNGYQILFAIARNSQSTLTTEQLCWLSTLSRLQMSEAVRPLCLI